MYIALLSTLLGKFNFLESQSFESQRYYPNYFSASLTFSERDVEDAVISLNNLESFLALYPLND